MNLSHLSDGELIGCTMKLVQSEREILTKILWHLREIERRKLFSQYQCTSLFDYCVRKLHYSEDQAARRIAAMRLLKELPELESKIEDGSLTLSNLGLAQAFFRAERKALQKPLAREVKLEMLEQIENKSFREAKRIVVEQSSAPELLKPDQMRELPNQRIEIKFTARPELQLKLEQVKGLLAHRHPEISIAELIDQICDIAIHKLDPGKRVVRERRARGGSALSGDRAGSASVEAAKLVTPAIADPQHVGSEAQTSVDAQATTADRPPPATSRVAQPAATDVSQASKPTPPPATSRPRHIPAHIRREVWRRADSRCTSCGSRHALEIEHKVPFALGGTHGIDNLTLLCRNCNQRAGINLLGLSIMER